MRPLYVRPVRGLSIEQYGSNLRFVNYMPERPGAGSDGAEAPGHVFARGSGSTPTHSGPRTLHQPETVVDQRTEPPLLSDRDPVIFAPTAGIPATAVRRSTEIR